MKTHLRKTAAIVVLSSIAGQAFAADTFSGTARDAWITGKIETVFTLNRHLNPFTIDTDVENGIAMLSGSVESDIDRDLAVELAKNVDGVVEVRNEIVVEGETARAKKETDDTARADGRSFTTWVDDATTTAAVKTRLIANSNTQGLDIDVDTMGDIVTLSGHVDSDEQKTLAAEIAKSTGDVRDVRNNLVVDASAQ